MSENERAAVEMDRRAKILALQLVLQLPGDQTEALTALDHAKKLVLDFLGSGNSNRQQRVSLQIVQPTED